ncbi:hypothetical protein HN859_01610, partial [Candidatus Parcubacteria bacterium]|nr:hypothetical protein [Candidatus Parcubacteria bacterium]
LDKIKKIKEKQALNWYNVDPEKLQERLEKAVENNGVGSKFKQIRNYTTLEEMGVALPEELSAKIDAAKAKAEEKLGEKLDNISPEDQEKLEKYIHNIKTSATRKQVITDELKDSEKLPQAVKARVKKINSGYSTDMRERFNNLSDQEKEKFLENFDTRAHPTYLRALEDFEVPENLRTKLQQLRERQEEGVKKKIQNTTNPIKLRTLETNLQNYPSLRLEAREQRRKIPAPTQNPILQQGDPTRARQ